MSGRELYIGLMSGTSADSIDAAIVDLGKDTPELLCCYSHPIESKLKHHIHLLASPGDNEIDQLGVLDRQLGDSFADAVNALLDKARINKSDIKAIGSHGQTIRHRPPNTIGSAFSLQVGDPNTIALKTGITTVADFRRKDIAAGGQGAPLTPAFHDKVFRSTEAERVIVNIGGMANITHLALNGGVSGFDTGPGNVLLDAWVLRQKGEPFDRSGHWAANGTLNQTLLEQMLLHPFFQQTGPKSTGREIFNPLWLDSILSKFNEPPVSADVQATLLELTAITISQSIMNLETEPTIEILICGGGVHNSQLIKRLRALMSPCQVNSTDSLGIPADWVEAMAFAWLAQQNLKRASGNIKAVTGAGRTVVLGGVYFA